MPKRQTVTKKQGGILAMLFTMLILLCGALFSLAGGDVVEMILTPTPSPDIYFPPIEITETPFLPDVVPSGTPVILEPDLVPLAGGWWDVYFTDPVNLRDPNVVAGSVEEKLIRFIDSARTSIHIASFEFDLTNVANALIAAKARGVDVRWVTDDEHGLGRMTTWGTVNSPCSGAAGVEVRDDLGRTAFMHNKFWIFDRQTVWTGSTNITRNGSTTRTTM
jgi:hypothetical protein